jgi:SAM-dependent methyltransferase
MSSTLQPAGNYYDKYGSRNPIVRTMMAGFLAAFEHLVETSGADEALEIGCGEGELSIRMAQRGLQVRACDMAPEVIHEARLRARASGTRVHFWSQRLEDMVGNPPAPLVVCCEVLEHLDDPEAGLDVLVELAEPWLLCSVPREPLWRVLNMARGRYLGDLGNTPGHVNHWSSRGFVNFISRRFDIVECRRPLPWTMLLCRRRSD